MHMDQRVPGIGDAAAEIVVLVEEKDVRIEPAEAQEQVAADEKAAPERKGAQQSPSGSASLPPGLLR